VAFNPNEIAEIIVNGQRFRDWESVQVHLAEGESNSTFKFSVSEGMPLARDFASVRIRPGEHCTIMLAGQLAISGYVETRQVAYTATQHGVELSGVSKTKALADGAVMHETMEFKNKTFQQIADEIVKPFGIKFVPLTALPQKKIERLNVPVGQSAWTTLEELARDRGIILGSDTQGNLTGRKGGAGGGGGDMVIEGKNILEGSERWSLNGGGGPNTSVSQNINNDYRSGPDAAHVPSASADNKIKGHGTGAYAPNTQIANRTGDKEDMKNLSENESERRGQEQLQVTIVVQGWLRPSGGLWKPGQNVHVKSPMLIVDEPLKLVTADFTQDSKSGTRTKLELKRDTGEDGKGNEKVDYSSAAKDPAAAAKADTTGGSGPGVGPG
jgi:prophage tail gpP-like protein